MTSSLPSTMKAVVIQHPLKTDFANLSIEERPVPRELGPTQVLIKVKAVSLNARDAQIASGRYPAPIQVAAGIIAGSDAAGDVVAIGKDVSRVKIGDRVTPIFSQSFLRGQYDPDYQKSGLGGGLDGVLSEYFWCSGLFLSIRLDSFLVLTGAPAEEGVVSIPKHLNYTEACTSPIAGVTAWHCLYGHPGASLSAGQTVLVLGTGGVSIIAAQIALASGCKVIATSSSDEKLARIKKLGVHETINYRTHPEWEKEVIAKNGGRGVDHVIEIGGAGTLVRSIRSCQPGGNVWIVGYMSDYAPNGNQAQQQPEYAKEILYSQAVVRGVVCGSRDMFEDLNRCVEINKIEPVVDKVFPFEQTQEAYCYLDSGKHFGKVVISLE
ncbi:zinc-dependent alcohol dehydrogenase family protein [Sporobolomyces salmoneus]|uniref:zinc-dependent alcohol dehydrogenase family protein n=1 Tax=Sporobolomyces salmoneus TaxID=183962 RepID=UPI00317F6AB5